METITVDVFRDDVYDEVAKATDYTSAKLLAGDPGARERLLATDAALGELGLFWDESVTAANARLGELLVSGSTKEVSVLPVTTHSGGVPGGAVGPVRPVLSKVAYEAVIAVSVSFDRSLAASVQSSLRSFFVDSVLGRWYRLCSSEESAGCFARAGEWLDCAERLLYSRKPPGRVQ